MRSHDANFPHIDFNTILLNIAVFCFSSQNPPWFIFALSDDEGEPEDDEDDHDDDEEEDEDVDEEEIEEEEEEEEESNGNKVKYLRIHERLVLQEKNQRPNNMERKNSKFKCRLVKPRFVFCLLSPSIIVVHPCSSIPADGCLLLPQLSVPGQAAQTGRHEGDADRAAGKRTRTQTGIDLFMRATKG